MNSGAVQSDLLRGLGDNEAHADEACLHVEGRGCWLNNHHNKQPPGVIYIQVVYIFTPCCFSISGLGPTIQMSKCTFYTLHSYATMRVYKGNQM